MIISIIYKNGRGHCKLDLAAALPASVQDMKRILSFLQLSDNRDADAEKVHEYISGQIDRLSAARASLDPDRNAADLAKINSEIKKYIRNAGTLSKEFGLPEINDTDAEISLKKSDSVFSLGTENEKTIVRKYDGFTFEKSGFVFDVYTIKYDRKTEYIILLSGTGLKVAEAWKRSEIITAVTPRIIDSINKADLASMRSNFKTAMIDAGYLEAEAPEPEPAPATAADPKASRGPVPEKTFIGSEIIGEGWKIYFDGDLNRTRFIFTSSPTPAALQAVENAGFYYSRVMNSWNKKLTFKAYRAAVALAKELNAA